MMKGKIRIVLVDDHKIFRVGLEHILNGIKNFMVTGSFPDGNSLEESLKKDIPDVIFMDLKMPGKNGVFMTRFVKDKYPDIKVIALTMFGEIEYFNNMLDAGVDGFLLKNTDINELETAVSKVINGENYFAKEFLGHLNVSLKNKNQPNTDIHLSDREIEVLKLICEGYSNNEIAEKLFISIHTVDGHRRNLISKTGVKNAPNLVLFAVKNGLLD